MFMEPAVREAKLYSLISARQDRGECCVCGRFHKFKNIWASNDVGKFILDFFERKMGAKNEYGFSILCGYCSHSIRGALFLGKYAPVYHLYAVRDCPANERQERDIEFLLIEWLARKLRKMAEQRTKG